MGFTPSNTFLLPACLYIVIISSIAGSDSTIIVSVVYRYTSVSIYAATGNDVCTSSSIIVIAIPVRHRRNGMNFIYKCKRRRRTTVPSVFQSKALFFSPVFAKATIPLPIRPNSAGALLNDVVRAQVRQKLRRRAVAHGPVAVQHGDLFCRRPQIGGRRGLQNARAGFFAALELPVLRQLQDILRFRPPSDERPPAPWGCCPQTPRCCPGCL